MLLFMPALLERIYTIHYFEGCWREDKNEISPKWIQKLLANTAVEGVFCTFFNLSLKINSMTVSSYLFGYAAPNKKSYNGENEDEQEERKKIKVSASPLPPQTQPIGCHISSS